MSDFDTERWLLNAVITGNHEIGSFSVRQNRSQFSVETTYEGLGTDGLDVLTGKIMFSHDFLLHS